MKGFLDYLPGSSVLHRMHPLVKIFVSVLICAASFCSSNPFYLTGVIVFNVLMALAGSGSLKNGNGLFKHVFSSLKNKVLTSCPRLIHEGILLLYHTCLFLSRPALEKAARWAA